MEEKGNRYAAGMRVEEKGRRSKQPNLQLINSGHRVLD